MKKVVILQKYLAPYRVPLFNGIADHPEVDLTVLYYGTLEERRKWTVFPERRFTEVQTRCLSLRKSYEGNFEIPVGLLGELVALKPDMIVCAPDSGGIAAYLYVSVLGGKYVIWSESTPVTERAVSPLKRRIRSLVCRNASAVLVPGKQAEEYIEGICPTACFVRANNTIEEVEFSLDSEEIVEKFTGDRITFTFSGSLVERKGVVHLLEAFSSLMRRRPELRNRYRLRLVGTGPLDIEAYRQDNVVFEGFCEAERYQGFMKESHVCVLPSVFDCNPLTVIEGLYAGNVLILSDGVGNAPEALDGNGFLVRAASTEDLAGALERMADMTREELTAMALRSREIAGRFSTANSIDGFLEAILADGACFGRRKGDRVCAA